MTCGVSPYFLLVEQYLLELSVVEYELVPYVPTLVATAVACLSLYTRVQPYHVLLACSGYSPLDLIRPVRLLILRRVTPCHS
jgi:hypothetical protein